MVKLDFNWRTRMDTQTFLVLIKAERTFIATLPRNDLLSRLYWGTQWTMEIS